MIRQATELEIIKQVSEELEADGYEVFIHPSRHVLPDFLHNFMPDAIALRDDKKIAIEVIRKSIEREQAMERVAGLFAGHDDWEFRVIWITPAETVMVLDSQTGSLIRTKISEIKKLMKGKHFAASFLLSWATLEAVGRTLLPQRFERPQTPGRLIQVLAVEGYVTPTEADSLRQLADKRNKLIHGELKTRITESNVSQMVDVLTMLSKMVEKSHKTDVQA